jgi:hypothetical protein
MTHLGFQDVFGLSAVISSHLGLAVVARADLGSNQRFASSNFATILDARLWSLAEVLYRSSRAS